MLLGFKHVVKHNTATRHVDINREWLRLRLGLQDLSLVVAIGAIVGPGKLSHQRIATVVVKVDARNVRVVEGAGTARFLILSASRPVEGGCLRATSTGARKGGTLELLILAGKSLQQVGSALRGELIVSETDTDRTPGQIKAVHLLQCLSCLCCVAELNKSVPATSTVLVLLQLDKLKLAKRLKNSLQVLLRHVEVDVADVEPMEGDGVGVSAGFGVAGLSVLFGFCQLNNDRNT